MATSTVTFKIVSGTIAAGTDALNTAIANYIATLTAGGYTVQAATYSNDGTNYYYTLTTNVISGTPATGNTAGAVTTKNFVNATLAGLQTAITNYLTSTLTPGTYYLVSAPISFDATNNYTVIITTVAVPTRPAI